MPSERERERALTRTTQYDGSLITPNAEVKNLSMYHFEYQYIHIQHSYGNLKCIILT